MFKSTNDGCARTWRALPSSVLSIALLCIALLTTFGAKAAAPPAGGGAAEADVGSDQEQATPAPEATPVPIATVTLEQAKKIVATAEKEAALEAAKAEAKRKEGFWWDKNLSVGATAFGLFNRQFVGQQDGLALQVGMVAAGNLVLGLAGHTWTSAFSLTESIFASPNSENLLAPVLSKAADQLTASTEYRFQYAGLPWVGPFSQLRLQTTILPTWVTRAETTRVVKANIDADPLTYVIGPNLPISTASFFEPLIFNESAGVFFQPPAYKTWIITDFKFAGAAQNQLAYGGYVVDDNPDSPELELSQIAIVNSLGVQAEASVSGSLVDRVSYHFRALLFYPVLALGPGVEDVSLLERTHLEIETKTSVKLASWLSLDGVVTVRRQPFVLNDWQLQASMLLTSSFQIL